MKKYLLLILLCSIALRLSADTTHEFTTLDWAEMRIDTLPPYYTEVVPLESDYRLNDYTVTLLYPEYAPLTADEQAFVELYDSLITSDIRIESQVAVQRKVGYLDISFIPLIRRGQQYLKLKSAKLTITATPKQTAQRAPKTPKSRYASHSVLAEGRWVKISITTDGMYRLTRSALKAMGFTRPEKVRLFGYGGHRQSERLDADHDFDDLEEVPLYYSTATDSWLFWGNGLMHWQGNTRIKNHYANEACYFITEGETPAALETLKTPTGKAQYTCTTFTDHILYERDQTSWYAGGRELFDGQNFADNHTRNYSMQTLSSAGDEQFTIAITAGASTPTVVTPRINGKDQTAFTLGTTSTYTHAVASTRTYSVNSLANSSGNWNIRISTTAGNDARLDYLALHYSRHLTPHNGFVAFSHNGNGICTFQTTAPKGHQVLRTGIAGEPATLVESSYTEGKGLKVTVEDATRTYVCFDPSYAFPQPQVVGTIENQDLHSLDSLDMVILVPSSNKLTAEAERLAQAHQAHDGLRVAVVRADQVYNEFSSGTPDATAYRRFMKMLYDRAQTDNQAPRYLLLFGDCAWDNRMLSNTWRNQSPADYLLCYESENSFSSTTSYVMEDYFGLLDDGEGQNILREKSDLGIGRFPVTTVAQAKAMVNKTLSHLNREHSGNWRNIVMVLGDDGDRNEHMDNANDVARVIELYNPEMEVRKVMWDAYNRVSEARNNTYPEVYQLLTAQMNNGAMVFNYTGHANPMSLSHEYVLNLKDFKQTTKPHYPLWVTAACDVMPFDGVSENIGETAVLNANGGALAFYGTTRTVYANQNLIMNRYFTKHLFACDAQGQRNRLGDAIRMAKGDIVGGNMDLAYLENKLHYALLGDPALVIGAPLNHVVLDSINGKAASLYAPADIKAGSHIRLTGHIETTEGKALTSFNGTLSTRMFDSPQTVTCKNNAGASETFVYQDYTHMLHSGQDSIRNGRFEISFVVPFDIQFSNQKGRLVFYAHDDMLKAEANGHSEAFTLGGISTDGANDKQGPKIYAYLNNEDFQDGGTVNAQPFFVAHLEDASGINVSGNGVGHDLELCIDGNPQHTYNLNEHYTGEFGNFTQGSVSFSIPTLSPGAHTLTFRAWDVLNNTSQTTLHFVVDEEYKPQLLQLSATQNPATTSTHFRILHNLPGAECTITIDVFDFAGRRVWTTTQTGGNGTNVYEIPWNLCTPAGGRLGTGIYLYRCTLQNGKSKKVSDTQKIIIQNNK